MSWWSETLVTLGWANKAPTEPVQIVSSVGEPVAQSYEAIASMASVAAFPWVRACIDAIATDLASLPLKIVKGSGAKAEQVELPELRQLLDRPTSAQGHTEWERQILTYLLLSGNAYAIRVGKPAKPSSLPLLHPEGVKILPSAYGFPDGYEWTPHGGSPTRYNADLVVHWKLTQWQYGAQGLSGEGLIRALANDLSADLAASKLSASQSKQGRPSAIISQADGDTSAWTKEQRDAIAAGYTRIVSENRPVMVVPSKMKTEFPTYSLRDMEFSTQRTLTRETILAAFGVPPCRVGLPTANYATSQQQMAVYWTHLQGIASILDAGYTAIAVGFGPDLRVAHDFSGVESLQAGRDSRLNRVSLWNMLGADAAEAAAYEGFTDAPLSVDAAPKAPATDTPPAKALTDWFAPVVSRKLATDTDILADICRDDPSEEEGRAAIWRGWLDDVHTPSERTLARAVKRALTAQATAIAAKLPELLTQKRDISASLAALVDALFTDAVQAMLPAMTRDAFKAGVRLAFGRAAKQVGSTLAVKRVDPVAEQLMALMVKNVNASTSGMIAEILGAAIDDGATVNDMQDALMRAAGFSPMRALRIARTETTRSAAAGSEFAWKIVAADTGVGIESEWLTARDGEVRHDHMILDGQVKPVGGVFTVPYGRHAGETASGPGDFADASMVVNCRCTLLPVIKD